MQSSEMIITDPFFGSVLSKGWELMFHPPSLRSDIGYNARYIHRPTLEDYQALGPRLLAFESFCRNANENDQLVQSHFSGWPRSAGSFQLAAVIMRGVAGVLGDRLPWSPTSESDDRQPFALQYRAADHAAWAFAGVPWWPPLFVALFDEAGSFKGVDWNVEQAMRDLPASIAPSRWEGGYRHPYFGRCKLAPFSRLASIRVGDRKIPLDLSMTKKRMQVFEPEHLDDFVPLAERLGGLDAEVRLSFPEALRTDWLEERFTYETPAVRRALENVFPGATGPGMVSREAFVAALVFRRGCFSLSPEISGGAALTLNYGIIPLRSDNNIFAAKFLVSGDLSEIVVES